MSIIEEDVYSYKDPDPIVPYGVGIVTFGLTQWDALDGYGPSSRGLLWQLYQIWFDTEFYDNISTSWTNDNSSITTSWTDDNAVITTTWANEGVLNGY